MSTYEGNQMVTRAMVKTVEAEGGLDRASAVFGPLGHPDDHELVRKAQVIIHECNLKLAVLLAESMTVGEKR